MSFSVFGAGAWGFALADLLAKAGHKTTLWGRNVERVEQLAASRSLSDRMVGCSLSDDVVVTSSLVSASDSDVFVFAIPTPAIRDFVADFDARNNSATWINAAKGIEQKSLITGGEVFCEFATGGTEVYTLSGPSHAEELARMIPTSIVLAGRDKMIGSRGVCGCLPSLRS